MQTKFCQWNFKDDNNADDQLTAKTLKIMSLKNFYVYSISGSTGSCSLSSSCFYSFDWTSLWKYCKMDITINHYSV